MKIAVLVSGGVDSSVALKLLKDQGHDVTAFYLKIWLEDELFHLGQCPWEEDLAYVRAVCAHLAVPLEVISLQKEYWERVVTYTVAQARVGYTPNPDILCNQQVKFGAFLDAIGDQYEKVASGHYAQLRCDGDAVALYTAPDVIKDQTYFLSQLSQRQFSRLLFPIGHLTKSEVRSVAHAANLPNKSRKDSQGICFLGAIRFDEFLKHHLGERIGELIELEAGKVVGMHNGFWFYTIGQRKGLGLAGGPWYVASKDVQKNRVYISRNYYTAEKKRNSFEVARCNWILGHAPKKSSLSVKLRHGKQQYVCCLKHIEKDRFHVELSAQDQGIAAGQFAVFYDGKVCLGGGVINMAADHQ